MDDEDDRRLLDIIGDVDLLNDYLHGNNSKSIGEDDVTNAAYGSDGAFFAGNTAGSDVPLKDGSSSTMGEFGEDSAGAGGLQLSSSLSFIEDELVGSAGGGEEEEGGSPEDLGGGGGGEDQPFDILQKSLMEADITEQTLAQEAMLDSQPPPVPVVLQAQAPLPSSQLVSGAAGGGYGGHVVTSAPAGAVFPAGQFLQAHQLPNGVASHQHIQVLGSFGGVPGCGGVMTLSSLGGGGGGGGGERAPQIVFRPGGGGPVTGAVAGGQVFAPTTQQQQQQGGGQVGLPLKNIPLQNFIIQRGPGGTQTLVRHIQPKPPQGGGGGAQTVYSLGPLQPTSVTTIANTASPAAGQQYTMANGSIVVHSPLGQQQQQQTQQQQQQQAQTTSLQPGQFLLPGSLALAPAPSSSSAAVQNGPAHAHAHDPASSSGPTLITTTATNQNTVQIVTAGQSFTATPGGQLILNHQGGQVTQTQTWTGFPAGANQNQNQNQNHPVAAVSVQTSSSSSSASGRLTLVGPAATTAGAGARTVGGQAAAPSSGPVQRLLVTQTQNCTALSPLPPPGSATQQEQQDYRQDSPSPAAGRQGQHVTLHAGNTAVNTMTASSQDSTLNAQVSTLKRPALPQLTRGGMILQQLRKDHSVVGSPDRRRFTSLDDALLRLLPYHVFHGAPPGGDEFSQVDEEFETVATQVLKRTQAMVNKYRRLLIVESERSSPSSEMVMIDRTFNQEERNNLTQDRRMVLVDPDGFQEDFCCGVKKHSPAPAPEHPPLLPDSGSSSCWRQTDGTAMMMDSTDTETTPPYRTEPQPGYGDPGGGGGGGGDAGGGGGGGADLHPPPLLDSKSMLDLKRSQQQQQQGYGVGGYPHQHQHQQHHPHHHHHGNLSPMMHYQGGSQQSLQASPSPTTTNTTTAQPHYPPHELASPPPPALPPPPPDTDSVLEAAVNSILEC